MCWITLNSPTTIHAFCCSSFIDYVLTTTIRHFETLWTLSTPSLLYSVLDEPLHLYAGLHSSFTFVNPSSKHHWNPLPLAPCSHIFLSVSRNKVSLWDDTLDFVIRRVGCSFIVADGDFMSVSLRKQERIFIRIWSHTADENKGLKNGGTCVGDLSSSQF